MRREAGDSWIHRQPFGCSPISRSTSATEKKCFCDRQNPFPCGMG
jgi:hypothetical protein